MQNDSRRMLLDLLLRVNQLYRHADIMSHTDVLLLEVLLREKIKDFHNTTKALLEREQELRD